MNDNEWRPGWGKRIKSRGESSMCCAVQYKGNRGARGQFSKCLMLSEAVLVWGLHAAWSFGADQAVGCLYYDLLLCWGIFASE